MPLRKLSEVSLQLLESRYCYTRHKMSWDGNTVSVTKRCVAMEDCLETGCSDMDHEGNRVRTIKYNSHYASNLCHARPTV